MPKGELVQKDSLTQQCALVRTWGERFYNLWKKGQVTLEDYTDAMRLCKEKIRRAEAQLELVNTGEKNNKNVFANTSATK